MRSRDQRFGTGTSGRTVISAIDSLRFCGKGSDLSNGSPSPQQVDPNCLNPLHLEKASVHYFQGIGRIC